jgi:hypothetical protein
MHWLGTALDRRPYRHAPRLRVSEAGSRSRLTPERIQPEAKEDPGDPARGDRGLDRGRPSRAVGGAAGASVMVMMCLFRACRHAQRKNQNKDAKVLDKRLAELMRAVGRKGDGVVNRIARANYAFHKAAGIAAKDFQHHAGRFGGRLDRRQPHPRPTLSALRDGTNQHRCPRLHGMDTAARVKQMRNTTHNRRAVTRMVPWSSMFRSRR